MYQGASNHVELHNLMKATLMIRRLKKDVLSELPLKRRQQVCGVCALCGCVAVEEGPVTLPFVFSGVPRFG